MGKEKIFNMRIAFLIMAHNNVSLLNTFIRQLLVYEGSFVYIHIDEKGIDIIPKIIDDERVCIIPEHFNGSWGDYTQVQMVNALISYAHSAGEFDYYSLHSGVDLCVRPIQELVLFLEETNCYGYYECDKLPNHWQYGGGLGRVALTWPQFLRKATKGYHPIRIMRALYGRLYGLGIIKGRKIPDKYQLYGGAAWFTVRNDCVTDYLKFITDEEYNKLFYNGLCGDEIYYVSVFQMCKANRRVMDHNLLRFVDWKERGQKLGAGSPNVIDMSFVNEIEAAGHFFARKFSQAYDNDVIDYFVKKTMVDKCDE